MRIIKREELEKILMNHQHWIKEDCKGWEDMRADLSNADLSNADLRSADLWNANLRSADLSNADLWNANLRSADLSNANLSNANLRSANLRSANLRSANLRSADLWNANLRSADLRSADLSNADLSNANLSNANLSNANLRSADLWNANLSNANLRSAKELPFIPMACPDSGAFTAWKKAGDYIVKLFIPSDARRLSATGRKCRCDKAMVIGIENTDGTPAAITEVCSDYDRNFKYSVHAHLHVDNFCVDRWQECSAGIHFFINREEAVNYR